MNTNASSSRNPLARTALTAPSWLGQALSLAGRALGGGLALVVAAGEDYDRTRLLGVALAVATLASFAPVPPRFRGRAAWIGAGLLFFGGALLTSLAAGLAMLATGAVAALGAALDDEHRGRPTGVPSFFTGFGLTLAIVTVIVLTVEG